MEHPIRIAICQISHIVGDVDGNATRIEEAIATAAHAGADLALLPECSMSGYPAHDLWLDHGFVTACERAMTNLAEHSELPALVGGPRHVDGTVRNSCAFLRDGLVEAWYDKQCLPNYGVFDEERWFTPGREPLVIDIAGARVGVSICEDLWVDGVVASCYGDKQIDVLVNLSASPYHTGRAGEREVLVSRRARELNASVVLCNRVGGQDHLVFDGGSVAASANGTITDRCVQFAASVHVVTSGDERTAGAATSWLDPDEEVWGALQNGLRDYVHAHGCSDVVVGISGGIDSALVATLAVDTFGSRHVHGVTMPSDITSSATLADARTLATNLGIVLEEIPIAPVMSAYGGVLDPVLRAEQLDITEENLQARIRGTLLMALFNQHGWFVLTTGNKSETAVGYSTLYGDTAGAFAPIQDIAKTRVWELARWRNQQADNANVHPPIPATTIERPPTAELRHDQRDEDTLPPYDVLDQILEMHIEQRASLAAIVDAGCDRATAARVIELVRHAEFKRRQSPPGIRVTPLAFGLDRRMPITNSWRSEITAPITT